MKRTLAIALIALLPGCFWVTTKHEGQQLRKDVDNLDERVQIKEESLQSKIAELEEVLQKATRLLQRNSADLGADVQALAEDNAKLTGLVKDAERTASALRNDIAELKEQYDARLNTLEARLVQLELKANQPPPKTADEVFQLGADALASNNYKEARIQFATFVRKWPGHPKAAAAMFHWGEGYARDGNHEKAIAVFQKVFDEYKSSDVADDALYEAGQSAEQLKWCTDAKVYYGALQQKYPKSEFKTRAAKRLRYLKKVAKNRSKCKS